MYDTVPTVRIKREGRPRGVIINESAFDPAIHELYEPAPELAARLPADIKGGANGENHAPPCPASGESVTVVELRDWFKANDVQFPSAAPKAELVALYDAIQLSE